MDLERVRINLLFFSYVLLYIYFSSFYPINEDFFSYFSTYIYTQFFFSWYLPTFVFPLLGAEQNLKILWFESNNQYKESHTWGKTLMIIKDSMGILPIYIIFCTRGTPIKKSFSSLTIFYLFKQHIKNHYPCLFDLRIAWK